MKAFHNDPKIKSKYLKRVSAHIKADEIIKGKYWENGKGCAVGCTIHGSNHAEYESQLGIPASIAILEDGIFEGLPNELAKTWPKRFLESINVGADLSRVMPKFFVWLLVDTEWGVIRFAKTDAQREAIERVADLYQAKIAGLIVEPDDWREACSAAADATAASAYATADATADATAASAYAAAAASAYAAADATAASAYAAADATADATAASAYADATADATAARSASRVAQSEKVIELLKESK